MKKPVVLQVSVPFRKREAGPGQGRDVWQACIYDIIGNKALLPEVEIEMSNMPKDMDVAKRAKVIEWLKTAVIDQVSRLFKSLWEGSTLRVGDSLASLLMSSYILGRRLGIPYRELDELLLEKLKKHRQEGHQLEDWYQDISALEEHMRKR